MQPNNGLASTLLGRLDELPDMLIVLRKRPLDIHRPPGLDARQNSWVMHIHAGTADYEVDVGVVGEVLWATVGACAGGEVVVRDCAVGGVDGGVEEGDDGVFGEAARGEEVGEVRGAGPGCGGGGGEADDGGADGRHGVDGVDLFHGVCLFYY